MVAMQQQVANLVLPTNFKKNIGFR